LPFSTKINNFNFSISTQLSFRLQIATLDGGKGDKPYKIMMACFILQEIVGLDNLLAKDSKS
jgi:hypothetical protein